MYPEFEAKAPNQPPLDSDGESVDSSMPRANFELATIAVVLGLALGLRLVGIRTEWLWYDDVFGPLFSQLSLFDLHVVVARFDIHPPLWNYQLWLWAIFGSSDRWFMFNSIAWSMAATYSLYVVTRRHFGFRLAIIATTIFAAHPLSIMFAQQVRMYPMLMCFMIWAWDASERYFISPNNKTLRTLFLLELALSYTHGTGLILASYFGVYGLATIYRYKPSRDSIKYWFIMQAIVVALAIPAVVNGSIRSVTHTIVPNLEAVISCIASLVLGPTWTAIGQGYRATFVVDSIFPYIGFLFVVLVAVLCAKSKDKRYVSMTLFVYPLVFSLLLSYTVKPIWYMRAFLPIIPFICLSIATALDMFLSQKLDAKKQVAFIALTFVCVTGLTFGSGQVLEDLRKPTNFKAAIADVEKRSLTQEDVLWVPLNFDFWSAAWYFKGYNWGSPLAVQDLQPLSGKWGEVIEKLKPNYSDWLTFFNLLPKTPYIEKDGVRMYIGEGSQSLVLERKPKRIFLIQTDLMTPGHRDVDQSEVFSEVSIDWTKKVEIPGYEVVNNKGYTRLWVKEYRRVDSQP